jgi:lysyl-tRNA synthetase class I
MQPELLRRKNYSMPSNVLQAIGIAKHPDILRFGRVSIYSIYTKYKYVFNTIYKILIHKFKGPFLGVPLKRIADARI